MHSGQYDILPSSDDSTWMQLQEQFRAEIHSKQILKAGHLEKPKDIESKTNIKDRAKLMKSQELKLIR